MHPHAQTHGNLLKWNTQSLTFTSVRPHSFDRKRIQTEWNHHQWGCCAIDLSSPLCSLTDRREHWREGGAAWTQHNHCASVSVLVCQNDTEMEKERQRGRETKRETPASVTEMKRGRHHSEPPQQQQQCTFENRYRRAKNDANASGRWMGF